MEETVLIHNVEAPEDTFPFVPTYSMDLNVPMNPRVEVVELTPVHLTQEIIQLKKDTLLERKNEFKNPAIIYTDNIVNEGITEKIANYAIDNTKIKPESIKSE